MLIEFQNCELVGDSITFEGNPAQLLAIEMQWLGFCFEKTAIILEDFRRRRAEDGA